MFVSTIFESGSVYESIARFATVIAAWASMKAERRQPTPEEAMQDLTFRLRHPWQYRISRVRRLLS